ncbi:MAG TPA: glycoside hydrolase family 75 protein [Verrucomicrobiales bacterium]|nr:glycoside hydrolase family 75 protein [Verrucomicrobiales bacterium]
MMPGEFSTGAGPGPVWPAQRKRRGGLLPPFFLLVLLLLAAGAAVVSWRPARSAAGQWLMRAANWLEYGSLASEAVYRDRVVEKPVEVIVEKEVRIPEPLPGRFVPYKKIDFAELYNGFKIVSELDATEGGLASLERTREEACEIRFELRIRVPEPNQSLKDLASLNEKLPDMLPGLSAMLEGAKVSGFYHRLYELKTKRMQTNLTRLDQILSRHNYYDCDTVLELTAAGTQRRLLLVQGDMDVVSDGSDGDRSPEYDEYIATSQYYQPFTSYGWAKRTNQPNPLLARWEEKLAAGEAELKKPGTTEARKKTLRDSIAVWKREIRDLRARSFLIARKDPFVVVPLSFLGYTGKEPFAPAIGDYAVVIHGERVFPAILGDAGPSFKVGEASLRIAQEIDPKSSPYRRPVSDLTVTYLVFPGTAERPFAPPDLARWRARCSELLGEIGGLGEGFLLHEWEDLFAQRKPQEETADTGEEGKEGEE